MVPDARFATPWIGLDRNEVEAQRKRRNGRPIRERDAVEQRVRRVAEVPALAVVDGLLRKPEVAPAAPADLDDHEHRRRARVDRHEIELVATDMDVPGEDDPAGFAQPRTDESLGGITRELRRRSRPSGGLAVHGWMLPADARPAITRRSSGAYPTLTWSPAPANRDLRGRGPRRRP